VRLLLFSSCAGASGSLPAAATAALAAVSGRKTLLLSAEPLLGPVSGPPVEIDSGLYAGPLNPGPSGVAAGGPASAHIASARAERPPDVLDLLRLGLHAAGVDLPPDPGLPALPGADAAGLLRQLAGHAREGLWDTVVVDAPPLPDLLSLLALPGTLERYGRWSLPALARLGGLFDPLPLVEEASRLAAELTEARGLLAGPGSSARLAVPATRAGAAASRRGRALLALHELGVDEVLAGPVVPAGRGAWQRAVAAEQRAALSEARDLLPGVPVRAVPYQPGQPADLASLADLGAAIYGGDSPLAEPPGHPRPETRSEGGDRYELRVPLPGVGFDEVQLARVGDDLAVTVLGSRRLLRLPSGLRRCLATGARVADGALHVDFVPDRNQWPALRSTADRG